MPSQIQSIEIMTTKFDQACNVIHCLLKALDLNGFTPNLRGGQILSPPQSNLTGHKLLVKLGGNSLRLHCMPACLNWVSSQWIYTQFDQ